MRSGDVLLPVLALVPEPVLARELSRGTAIAVVRDLLGSLIG